MNDDLTRTMAGYRAGRRDALLVLHEALTTELRHFFLSGHVPGASTEDLLAETFLHIHRARRTWREPLSVRGWALALARHVRDTRLRAARRASARRRLRGWVSRLWPRLLRPLPGARPRGLQDDVRFPRLTRWVVLIATLVLPGAGICSAQDPAAPNVPHVRAVDRLAREVLESAAALSPTVARLIERLQQSDVIVLVETGALLTANVNGLAHVFAAAPGVRYVRVLLRLPNDRRDLMRVLGHELRHALEVAESPDVRDSASMASFYRRVGVPRAHDNYFETDAAVRTGAMVARELAGKR